MGHSYTELCDKRFLAHDHTIQAWVRFLADVIDAAHDTSDELKSIVAKWLDHFEWAGNGCIHLELDHHFKEDPTLLQEFNTNIDRTQSHIGSFSPTIPAAYLNEQQGLNSRTGYQSDLPVATLLSYGRALSCIANGRTPETDVA